MKRYKLTITYDGTDYFGWQWQPEKESIQSILLDTFKGLFKQDHLYLVGASRTDAGVHARGQVVRIKTELADICPEKMIRIWNNALPPAIVINDICEVDEQFHPQHGIEKKIYEYTFYKKRPDPFIQRFGWFFEYKIDGKKLIDALSLFIGKHNFKAFCKEDSEKDTVKTVDKISVVECTKTGGYKIIVEGSSFLRHMIRRMVGSALHVASKPHLSIQVIKDMLLYQKTTKVLPTAPAKGLCLVSIEYK
jgi:tRNA pseudouridine38-40 synthase